ncbi:MAG: hypothetical protein SFV15_16580 [Polyangiaceae bacterium]|nr:hypothetical protein [Polyangiaceae bacterium]
MPHIARYAWFFFPLATACSHSDEEGDHHGAVKGKPTASVCRSSSAPTYASFGRAYMTTYCTTCHSSQLTGAARKDAPAGTNFDDVESVVAMAEHIDEHAAAGPAAVNTQMPPSGPQPSEAERRQLGQWLACEALGAGGVHAGGGASTGGAHD